MYSVLQLDINLIGIMSLNLSINKTNKQTDKQDQKKLHGMGGMFSGTMH